MTSLRNRYDLFQDEAVANVVADFKEKGNGRYLLVIPTGGGKTFAAVRAINRLYQDGVLSEGQRVAWVAHRVELIDQAVDTYERFGLLYDEASHVDRVDFIMLSEVKEHLRREKSCALVVIDEAHHGAAASYQPIFDKPSLGVLGLTATPSRYDGKPLRFDRESFSIGFPDLVEIGVLTKPTIMKVEGGSYELDDLDSTEALELLNNDARNAEILGALLENVDKVSKGIVYVGTVQHAKDLYTLFVESGLKEQYDTIGVITGAERVRYVDDQECREDRKEFIEAIRASERAIVVNVDVLTEGFDDPTVNAVVMARPTRSKLVYMQAMGRAVRRDPNDEDKQAFVFEVEDQLPNIRYRIDNRWLYSDVSDALEPAVLDVFYSSENDLEEKLCSTFESMSVPENLRLVPPFTSRDRLTALFFKVYTGPGEFIHVPIVITNENRSAVSSVFNFLSINMTRLSGLAPEQVFNMVEPHLSAVSELSSKESRSRVLQAMENAARIVTNLQETLPSITSLHPWISFVAFRKQRTGLDPELEAFISDMANADTIREALVTDSYSDGYFLVKLPLPLRGYWGAIIPPSEFRQLNSLVTSLETLQRGALDDQWEACQAVLDAEVLPIAQKHRQSLTTIVREDLDYFRELMR